MPGPTPADFLAGASATLGKLNTAVTLITLAKEASDFIADQVTGPTPEDKVGLNVAGAKATVEATAGVVTDANNTLNAFVARWVSTVPMGDCWAKLLAAQDYSQTASQLWDALLDYVPPTQPTTVWDAQVEAGTIRYQGGPLGLRGGQLVMCPHWLADQAQSMVDAAVSAGLLTGPEDDSEPV